MSLTLLYIFKLSKISRYLLLYHFLLLGDNRLVKSVKLLLFNIKPKNFNAEVVTPS